MIPATALIGWGQVRHTRHRPAHHAFAYPTAFLMLPMRSLRAGVCRTDLAINRSAWSVWVAMTTWSKRSAWPSVMMRTP